MRGAGGGGGVDCTYVNELLGMNMFGQLQGPAWDLTLGVRGQGLFVRLVVRLAQVIDFTPVEQGWISILPALTVHGL